MGLEGLSGDTLEKLLTSVEKRLPYGPRVVQVMLAMAALAFLAFCWGVIAPIGAQVLARVSGASASIPRVNPTLGQWIVFGLIVGLAAFSGWRISRTVRRVQSLVETATSEAREAKALLSELDKQSVRAKHEGDRLATLLTADHSAASTFVTTAKPKPETVERKRITDDELAVTAREKNGGLYLSVQNWKAANKTGVYIYIIRMLWYSPDLDAGKGGYLDWPWFTSLGTGPMWLHKAAPTQPELVHGFPHVFELLPAPNDAEGWRLNVAGKATILTKPRWRFVLELRWNDGYHPMLADVILRDEAGQKIADLNFYQGDDALRRAAAD